MKPMFSLCAALTLIGAQGMYASDADADAVEFFKCHLAEDGSMEALVELANDFEAHAAANGLEDFEVSYLSPIYSGDLSEGVFWWVGVAPSLSGAARANEIWEGDDNSEIRARFGAQISGCESSSLHRLIRTPDAE